MAARYSAHELLRLDDPGYRAHLAMHARRYRQITGGATNAPPLRSELGKLLERGARSLLGERRTLSALRVLKFFEGGPGRSIECLYKEIDAVVMNEEDSAPLAFFEVKSSVSPNRALRRAKKQLSRLRSIIRGADWGGTVKLCAILVVPEGAEIPPDSSFGACQLVDSLDSLASLQWEHQDFMVHFMSRTSPWERAVERGWVVEDDLLQRVRDIEAGLEPEPRTFSAGEATGMSSLAAALQGALVDGEKSK